MRTKIKITVTVELDHVTPNELQEMVIDALNDEAYVSNVHAVESV